MKRVFFLSVLAVLLAAAAGVMTFLYLDGAEQRAIGRYTLTTVLVSAGDIPAGTSLGDAEQQGLVEQQQFPEEYAPSNVLVQVDDANRGLVTPTDLAGGQILLTGDFVEPVEAPELLPVPDGKVAVSLSLDAAPRLGAFLIPGDFVAVFINTPKQVGESSVTQTQVAFPSLEVLAVAGVTEAGGIFDSDAQTGALLVTLAVDPNDATKLVNAAQSGQVYLSLLSDGTTVPANSAYTPASQP